MAKNNANGKTSGRKKAAEKPSAHAGIMQEVWGLASLALGLLVLMALVSRYAGRPETLGPIFGLRLSSGLYLLFGPLPALLVPCGIVAIGVQQLRGRPTSVRWLLAWSVLVVEVSALLAVHNIGQMGATSFAFAENLAGNAATYALYFVFGPHPLGPYFLLVMAILISAVLVFRTSAIALLTTVARGLAALWRGLQTFAASRPAEAEPEPMMEPEPDVEAVVEEANELADEEAGRRMEEELAAFRARKDEPITITTLDPPEPVAEEEEDEDEGEGQGFEPELAPKKPTKPYRLPDPDILSDPPAESSVVDREVIEQNSRVLEKTLLSFGVEGKVVNVSPGPVISRYEIELAPGIKVSRIVNLQDDISLAVGGQKIRIQAPIPGKSAVGIELPNPQRETVHFKHVFMSEAFRRSKAKLPVVIGKSISGIPFATDIAKMPHLLIAGQTGSGKSVCMNCVICSLLMHKTPDELRLIMIDPKKVEFTAYDGIPHLLSPVVTESREAVKALQWGVVEMERRYRLLAKIGARDIDSFNTRIAAGKIPEGVELTELENKLLPFIVIVVDELADLMMTASRDVETLIMRIAQLARAVGLHLIVATQRPSVDIITGPIKANLTSRIAFRTIQSTDSRTILGHIGAEKLLGMGDMLFLRNGAPDLERFHGAFISEEDVEALVGFIRGQSVEVEKIRSFEEATSGTGMGGRGGAGGGDGRDELFEEAARLVVSMGQGSTSLLQRRMKIGFARAGRLMDELHMAGIVGPPDGSKMRELRVPAEELEQVLAELRGGNG